MLGETTEPIDEIAPREFGVASSLFEARAIVVAEDFDAPLPPEFVAKLEGS